MKKIALASALLAVLGLGTVITVEDSDTAGRGVRAGRGV
jgi:hypothetical protein